MKNWLKFSLILIVFVSKARSTTDIVGNLSITNEPNNIDYRTVSFGFLSPESCRLQSKRFISNGLCTSPKPIGEVVCAESCSMPVGTRSPYTFHINSLRKRRSINKNQRRNPLKWKCVETSTRRKRVKLLCHDGTIRSYTLRLVTGCKCTPTPGKTRQTKTDEQKNDSESSSLQNKSVQEMKEN